MRKGFTLLELIIVIIVFVIIAGSAMWFFAVGLRTWLSGMDRTEIRHDSALAMERMVRELTQTKSITIAQEDAITFIADVNDDGADESINLTTVAGNLERKVTGVGTILARNVSNFQLAYYDLNDDLLSFPVLGADRDNVRVIEITLTMNKADETIVLSSGAYARNQ
ncbi:MAG: prepilin-type N-terminal cleavage/methylation domain-containing protein [Candidatus Omnitrophota bacterium]|nr:MAG: prepilin-type N-terminal cleavage/methylation domain-containing protein [Candidatus Omnitrophota bacterium]